ncbi:MAG TPA: universal stress protein [Candidatus Binataceae bacterium]|nr:universal stress protein [Candidatus Binataceae bacterium]
MIKNVKKILAPIDFSDRSMEAMKGALELAADLDAELHLVHVVVPHHTFIPLLLARNVEGDRELAREAAMVQQAEEELLRIKAKDVGGYKHVTTAVIKGSASQELAKYAGQHEIDLIMIATHGRSGAENLLLGSVAEQLTRHAPCSVLVFRRRNR